VDIDHRRLGLVRPVDCAIHGDAKLAAKELLSLLKTRKVKALENKETRIETLNKNKKNWEQELDRITNEKTIPNPTHKGLKPRQALRELEKAMPENVMVSTDIGNVCSVSNSYLRFDRPKSFFGAMVRLCRLLFRCLFSRSASRPLETVVTLFLPLWERKLARQTAQPLP